MRRGIKRKVLRDKIAGKMLLVLSTVLLVLGLAFFVSGTVLSQTEEKFVVDEKSLRILEQDYVREIRAYLEAEGFQNSGVTLTWVMEEDGSRSYEVILYHKNMNKLSEAEREILYTAVEGLAFQVNGCHFQVNLLV